MTLWTLLLGDREGHHQGVENQGADSLMTVDRCCKRLHLNSARPLACLFHLRAKFSRSQGLTCPRRCCCVFLSCWRLETPLFLLSPPFSVLISLPLLMATSESLYPPATLPLSSSSLKNERPFWRTAGWVMLLQLFCENQEGCSNSQCCQLCVAWKPPV